MSLLRTLLIDVAIAIAVLAVGEIVVRTFAPQQLRVEPVGLHETFEEGGYGFRPGANAPVNVGVGPVDVRINSLGMRDRERGPKEPGEYRILAVGNSFNANYGVRQEEMYTAVLERDLSARSDERVTVLNGGVEGWGPPAYLRFVEKEIDRVEPDLLLVMFFTQSDHVLADRVPKMQLRDGRIVQAGGGGLRETAERLFQTANGALEGRSHLFVLLRDWLDGPLWAVGLRPYPFSPTYRTDFNADGRYDVTYELYGRMRDLAASRGVKMLVLVVPAMIEFDEVTRTRYERYLRLDPSRLDVDAPRLAAERALDALGIPWLDLQPVFLDSNRHGPVYSQEYQHWNAAGNEIAAREISRWIREHDPRWRGR